MKILVVGLDCASPELLLCDERLTNFRRLMEAGCYGPLESVVPPFTVPAWMCMATSQDPGSLGVYNFRNRLDRSYDHAGIVNARSIGETTIWDQLAQQGKRSIVIGVPPAYPPRAVNGISVGCFLTPDPTKNGYTHPPEVQKTIEQLVGQYPVDVQGFRTDRKEWLRDEIYAMSRKQFTVVRHFLQNEEWDYLQFVEIGLDRLQHGFWSYHDPRHVKYVAGNPFEETVRDYYRHLDDEFGSLLELLTDDTIVLVMSDHGAQRLDGGFCVNDWLIREGLLVLKESPGQVTPFNQVEVDWSKTRVWSEGGYYAPVYFNVKGREPQGIIEPSDYEQFRDEVKARFEATVDPDGKPLGTLAFKPEEIYREVRNIAPDLIVHFGNLRWRSVGGVGYPTLHVRENETGPDDCNHSQHGAFILASSNIPLRGPLDDVRLLDMAPTLLDLAGYEIPTSMQGRSLVADRALEESSYTGCSDEDEAIIRERLSGLGYLA
jgi:predicted AlkP superfamily phosphohydrolase/phosphomutase